MSINFTNTFLKYRKAAHPFSVQRPHKEEPQWIKLVKDIQGLSQEIEETQKLIEAKALELTKKDFTDCTEDYIVQLRAAVKNKMN